MARHPRSDQVQFDADDDYESGVYDLGSLIQDDLSRGRVRRKRRNPVLLILLVVVVVAIGATAFFLGKNLLSGFGTTPDYAGSGGSQVNVRVNAGDSLTTIANSLHDANVVKSAKAFTNAAAANPKESSIQPGLYALKKQMKAQAALNLLLNPVSKLTKRVVIPEGLTVAQTLQKVADGTGVTIAALDAALKDVPNLGLSAWMPNKAAVPEGLLGPGTYDFDPSETPLEIVQEMIANFQSTAASINLKQAAAAIGQTPYNVLIIASFIEREAKFDDERPKIARVIYNRLAIKKPLQIDASTAYGAGKKGNELTNTDLASTTNPYNTYTIAALPPTPISGAGVASLKAALAPSPGNWIYYVVNSADGHHFFTSSDAEFAAAKQICKANGWC